MCHYANTCFPVTIGNGDESVKKIIASEAPKIANMTQQKLMDSRRRGGNMKQVFA